MWTVPKITKSDLKAQLRAFDFVSDDIVMIHASMRKVGEIFGGPDELINAIEEVLRDGTLLVYLGCPFGSDEVGRDDYSAEEQAFMIEHAPVFDKYL